MPIAPPSDSDRDSRRDSAGASLEADARDTAEGLRESLRRILISLGARARRPVDLTRSLRVNQVLAGKLHRVVKQREPLRLIGEMPGPEGVQIFLRAVADAGVERDLLSRAHEASDKWDRFLTSVGGRSALDALVTAWNPESRQKFELTHRQAAFRAMSALKGVMSEAMLAAVMLHPSDKPDKLHFLAFQGHVGLRRLKPGANVQMTFGLINGAGTVEASPVETIEGSPIGPDGPSLMLSQFSSDVPLRADVSGSGAEVNYSIANDNFTVAAPADLIFGMVSPRIVPAAPLPGVDGRTSATGAKISLPTQCLVLDVYLHRDVFSGAAARALGHDTVPRGEVHPRKITPEIALDILEAVDELGTGPAGAATMEVPKLPDILRWSCEKRGWDADAFRGYRLKIRYPMYGHKYLLDFYMP